MKYYAVAEVYVTNSCWVGGYLASVNRIIAKHGGRYLARTSNYDVMEGSVAPHQTVILLEFPSREAAYSFYNSEEYRPFREARLCGSNSRFYFVAGEDIAGGA